MKFSGLELLVQAPALAKISSLFVVFCGLTCRFRAIFDVGEFIVLS
jgi:hypothetical protein